jgi:TRAP-type mannitol/chloroaromatic compound transport system permease small subunit
VRFVEVLNRTVGRATMYLIFVMMGILLYGAISRSILNMPLLWAVEMAQFTMTAYYILGGPYSMQLHSHVRMDLLYGSWSPKTRAIVDLVTIHFLLFYVAYLILGGFASTRYAIEYGQKNYSAWGPPMAPIKIIMCFGLILMFLEGTATFFKDWAKAKGEEI